MIAPSFSRSTPEGGSEIGIWVTTVQGHEAFNVPRLTVGSEDRDAAPKAFPLAPNSS